MLITFEGIDGSGKSTQISMLERRLLESDKRVVVVREPGGTSLSEQIRELLLQKHLSIAPFAELLLFSAARAQLVDEVIRPRLKAGYTVICDRFTDSTLAYQGGGRLAADVDWLRGLGSKVTGDLEPDRTYYLAIDPTVAHRRSSERSGNDGRDRMESAGEEFYARVVETYEKLAATEPERVLRVDADRDPADIHDQIWRDLDGLRGRLLERNQASGER